MKTYTEMHHKKKEEEANKGKVSKCMTYVKRFVPLVIVLLIVGFILKGVIYRKMGWELTKPSPSSYNETDFNITDEDLSKF